MKVGAGLRTSPFLYVSLEEVRRVWRSRWFMVAGQDIWSSRKLAVYLTHELEIGIFFAEGGGDQGLYVAVGFCYEIDGWCCMVRSCL
jgi:hypothetical protein